MRAVGEQADLAPLSQDRVLAYLEELGKCGAAGTEGRGHVTPVSDVEVLRWEVPDLG